MAYTRVTFRGVTLNTRTRDMIIGAEKILGRTLVLSQGSYNKGGVSASAGTHDGGGAVDVSVRNMTAAQKSETVTALRRVGFAAWHRLPSQGPWVEHIHGIAVGDAELSSGARSQVSAYKAGRNGLASNGADNGTRAYVNVTWETYHAEAAKPVFHSWCINYATTGKGITGDTRDEASRFMGFAKSQGVVTQAQVSAWSGDVTRGDYKGAAIIFLATLKKIQAKGHCVVDGKFGAQTAAFVDNFGYRVVLNG